MPSSLKLTHPLMGADAATLVRAWRTHRDLPPRSVALLAAALGASLLRAPLTWIERVWFARRRGRPPDPIFIVGHWRSGTTHLYNVLSRDPQFGFVSPLATGLPWDFLLLGRLLRPLLVRALPEQRFVDRMEVRPDSPQEDEIALASMQPLSFYHGIYFPRRFEEEFRRGVFFDGCSPAEVERWRRRCSHFIGKISAAQSEKRLLIKNPVYTARVRLLREMWPGARFIHIHRNPYVVFQSMRRFYARLFRTLALEPLPEREEGRTDELILESYPRMMTALDRDAASLPPGHFTETRYEDLCEDPIGELRRIYGELGLEGFERARPAFERYLLRAEGFQKNAFRFSPRDNARLAARWRPFIERWGYEPPTCRAG